MKNGCAARPFRRARISPGLAHSRAQASAAGTCGFALGPLWGGSLFAASSAPGALGVLGKGRMFFIVLATLAAANSQLARPRVPRPRHAVDATAP